jgi:glycosyltransferase involved in cell wall biosynthesis
MAVLLPCYNEAATIADVIGLFQELLPEAHIFVYDNASTDETAARALEAGATIRHERERGKGNVVRRMFADIEADVYVLVDGDLTYDVTDVAELVNRLLNGHLDMIVGARRPHDDRAFRRGHSLGNQLFNWAANLLFGSSFRDIFSGYRVLSRRFVKSFPAVSKGFEIELELTVHAVDLRVPVVEAPVPYRQRPSGSHSKLRTIPDGMRIFWTLFLLCKEVRSLAFFSAWAALFVVISLMLGYPLVTTFLQTGLVPRFPIAIVATGLMLFAVVSVACGFILDSVGKGRHEAKRLQYLRLGAPPEINSSK